MHCRPWPAFESANQVASYWLYQIANKIKSHSISLESTENVQHLI